jgi:hypothetical protein
MGVLALAGLACGQTTPYVHNPTPAPVDRTIIVQELGKPGQKCKVLKTWREPDGSTATQVQALDTGELMTIVESEPTAAPVSGGPVGMRLRAAATRIIHWSRDGSAPPGSPEPPASAVVVGQPNQIPAAKMPAPKERRLTIPDDGTGATPPARVTAKAAPAVPVIINGSGDSMPTVVAQDVTAPAPEAAKKPFVPWAPLFTKAPAKPAAADAPAPAAKAADKPVVKAEVATATPGDWRESWGKIEAPKAPAPRADMPAPPAQTVVAAKPVSLPHADADKPDPLAEPIKYTHLPKFATADPPDAEKPPTLAQLAAGAPPATMVLQASKPTPPPPPAPPASPVPAKTAPVVQATENVEPTVKAPPAAEETKPAAPLGMASILAARSPELVGKVPVQAAAKAAQAAADEGNAFSPPPAKNPKSAVANKSANAFSQPPEPARPPVNDGLGAGAFLPPPQMTPQQAPPYGYPPPDVVRRQPPAGYGPPPAPYATQPVVAATYQDAAASLPQLLATLHDSLYPSQREWAAERLASFDWRRQQGILDALLASVRDDPAPMVRAESVRSLGRMKADTLAVVAAVRALRSDTDPAVRKEADEALLHLTGEKPPMETGPELTDDSHGFAGDPEEPK